MSITSASVVQSSKPSTCNNNVTHDDLRFQIPYRYSIVNVQLPAESLLFLQCCIQMASPSVNWFANSKPVQQYGNTFTLSEQGQVLYSNVHPPTGYYDCTASNGSASITETFIVRTEKVNPCCQLGFVGEVTKDKPPSDVYNVELYQSLQLECVAKIHCGFEYLANFLQWRKLDLRTNTTLYSLGQQQPYDDATRDYVNVSYTYDRTCGDLTIFANLTIANVSQGDLVYQNESLSTECDTSSRACNEIVAIAGYACIMILPGSDNPAQKTSKTKTVVRLHAISPTAKSSTVSPVIALAIAPGQKFPISQGFVGHTKQQVLAANVVIILGGVVLLACSLEFNEYLRMLNAFVLTVAASLVSKDTLQEAREVRH